ncbi:hypothetical protein MNBD_ALPHA09-56 [hydrothermal vent metagenome]|uniref:Uncharacterized protein n=1 Tax=hydrothermal vent metagenome TaxID=652676 RepID=A0A3B0T5A5_9ZZZZ
MVAPGRFLAGLVTLTIVFALAALLSDGPDYRSIPPQTGVLKLSFTHGSDRKADCRKLTAAEMEALAPNMRRKEICPRRRPPVDVELKVDGRLLFRQSLPPSGIAGDGPSRLYKKFILPAGKYTIAVAMSDNPRSAGFEYSEVRQIDLAAGQNLVIDFSPVEGGFVFR